MNTKLLKSWLYLKESMWFVPAIMTIIAILIAFLLVELDHSKYIALHLSKAIYGSNPAGARSILSTIAASMVTIAGVVFSINLVSLTLASSQYGPRLLRNFIKDRSNQIVLGTFIATFIYSLIVLLSIHEGEEYGFVPQIAIVFAFVLALGSLGVLIFFIHHTSSSIQADNIIKSAYNDLDFAIDKYIPTQIENQKEIDIEATITDIKKKGYGIYSIEALESGYILAIDNDTLMKTSADNEFIIRLKYQPGDFVAKGEEIVQVYAKAECGQKLQDIINHSVIIGLQRTSAQEVEFPINQIAEIAIRALSPGVNDPHTAITCIHWLGAGMIKLSKVRLPSNARTDDNGKLCIIRKIHSYEELLEIAFDSIRFHAAGNIFVSAHILKTLRKIMTHLKDEGRREAVEKLAKTIVNGNEERITEQKDLDYLHNEYQKLTIPY